MFVLMVKPNLNKFVSVAVYRELAFLLESISDYYNIHPILLTNGARIGWRSLEITLNEVADHILSLPADLPAIDLCRSGLNIDADYVLIKSDSLEGSAEMQLVRTICKSMMFMCREINSGSRNETIPVECRVAVRKVFRMWQQDCLKEMRRLRGQEPLSAKAGKSKNQVPPLTMYS